MVIGKVPLSTEAVEDGVSPSASG